MPSKTRQARPSTPVAPATSRSSATSGRGRRSNAGPAPSAPTGDVPGDKPASRSAATKTARARQPAATEAPGAPAKRAQTQGSARPAASAKARSTQAPVDAQAIEVTSADGKAGKGNTPKPTPKPTPTPATRTPKAKPSTAAARPVKARQRAEPTVESAVAPLPKKNARKTAKRSTSTAASPTSTPPDAATTTERTAADLPAPPQTPRRGARTSTRTAKASREVRAAGSDAPLEAARLDAETRTESPTETVTTTTDVGLALSAPTAPTAPTAPRAATLPAPAVEMKREAAAEAAAEAAPDDEPPARRRGTAKPRRPAAAPAVVPPDVQPAMPPVAEAAPAAPIAPPRLPPALLGVQVEAPARGVLFGDHVVRVPGEEPATVTVRSSRWHTAWCTCLDFALAEQARCPHILALQAWMEVDDKRREALARGPQGVFSRIGVCHGAQRQLLWLPGSECPPAVDALAQSLLDAGQDPVDEQALPRLLAAAREAGHELQVDDAAWLHLARQRDAGWRVNRLQTLLPDGPFSASLSTLSPPDGPALLTVQLEAALFALCAGRCILADAAEHQPRQQALAAATLWQQHFGVERVLVLAPEAALDSWRQTMPGDAPGWSLMALERVAGDAELHRSLEAELVIVDEPAQGGLWVDAERAAALLQLQTPYSIVLPAADWLARPAELPLRLAYVDQDRLGSYAALLHVHGQRDDDGELCGVHQLERLTQTLAPVLLARSLVDVKEQLPAYREQVRRVPMPGEACDLHAALGTAVSSALVRWQRVGWLPDAEQRRLVDQVQSLRRLCAGDDMPDLAQAKARAVLAVLNEGAEPVDKLVVFSQWPGALRGLQGLLAEAGIGRARWSSDEPEARRRTAAQRFETDPACRVLLVADGGGRLEVRCPQAQVLHLDRPWDPQVLPARVARVHGGDTSRLVPVTQVLAQASFEDRLFALQSGRTQAMTDLLEAQPASTFLQGAALAQWLSDLAQVLSDAPLTPA
jgi:hypothetical protein